MTNSDFDDKQLFSCDRCDEVKPILFPIIKQKIISKIDLGPNLKPLFHGEIDEEYLCMDCLLRQTYMNTLCENDNRESEKRVPIRDRLEY